MSANLKTSREQDLSMGLLAQKIKVLDEQYKTFLDNLWLNGKQLSSLNDLIRFKVHPPDENELIFTEIEFYTRITIPEYIKNDILNAYDPVFRR